VDNKRAVQILRDSGVYMPSVVPSIGGRTFHVFSGMTLLGSGETVDEAMERAGMNPPPVPPSPARGASCYGEVKGRRVADR
jgi:hypothetical protein